MQPETCIATLSITELGGGFHWRRGSWLPGPKIETRPGGEHDATHTGLGAHASRAGRSIAYSGLDAVELADRAAETPAREAPGLAVAGKRWRWSETATGWLTVRTRDTIR